MSVFKRLYDISRAELTDVSEEFDFPIRRTEETIKHLNINMDNLVYQYIEVKALYISAKKKATALKEMAFEYERKAILFLKKGQEGSLSVTEADKFAKQALDLMEQTLSESTEAEKEARNLNLQVEKMYMLIQKTKNELGLEHSDLNTMQSRVRLDKANKNFDRMYQTFDTEETIAMLERMKEKILLQEKIAKSYNLQAADYDELDAEIDKVLLNDKVKTTDALDELKKQMKIIKNES
jgi:phage shock protein A